MEQEFDFPVDSLTPFEADAQDRAEFAEWYDIYNSVDRFMESN